MPSHLSRNDVDTTIRVGLSIGLPLLVVYAVDRLDLAVYAAFGALTSLYGNAETSHRRLETLVVAAVGLVATIFVATVFTAAHGPLWLLGLLLATTALSAGTLGALMRWVPRGEIFFVLVLLVLAQMPIDWGKLPLAMTVATASAGLSVLIMGVLWRSPGDRGALRLSELRRRSLDGLTALDRRQHAVLILSAAAGVLFAWLLATALGVGHPYWASVTVAAVMPALASTDIYRRMAHLVLGTLAGVGVAAALFSFEPGHVVLIVIIVLCQMGFELFVSRQYGIALMFLSPLAIGMSNLSRGLPWQPLLLDRLTEAGLGAAVALVVIVFGRWILSKVVQPRQAT